MTITSAPPVVVRRAPRRRLRRRLLVGSAVVVATALAVAGTTYHRQIWSYATHLKGAPSHTWPYETPLVPPELRIAVAGDVGDSGTKQALVASAIVGIGRNQPYDVLLLLGDNVYPFGDPTQLPDRVFEPFAPVLEAGAELQAILGNHDVMRGNGDEHIDALGMSGRWWSQEYGDVLLIGLDSTQPRNPEQLTWLERTLTTTTATWRVVALHHPPYSAGYQGSSLAARDVFAPVFARHGVQLVLSGHDHDFQRSVPLAGVTYVVSGAGATSRRTSERSFTAAAYATPHFVDLSFYGDRLVLRAVDRDGRVFDENVLFPTSIPMLEDR